MNEVLDKTLYALNLEYLCDKHGITQKQLADKLMLQSSNISRNKKEKDTSKLPAFSTGKIAKYFNVTVDELVNSSLFLEGKVEDCSAIVNCDKIPEEGKEDYIKKTFEVFPEKTKTELVDEKINEVDAGQILMSTKRVRLE